MRKQIFTVLLIICVGLAFGFMSPATAEAASVKLTYSNFFPPGHIQSKLAESWCKEVEKRTNGEVVVEYYPGQTLTKARQVYDGVVEGLSDVGFSVLAYTRGRFPVMAAVDLPLGYTSGRVATQVINAVYKKFMPKELMDTQVMYLHAHGPGLIHTKTKAVRKMEDMKGLKFRGHGTSALVVQAQSGTQDGRYEGAQVQGTRHQRGCGQSPGRYTGAQTHAGNLPDASKRRGGWCGVSL